MKRGQSAYEFLITYSWAIILLIAIIGILYYYGMFNPQRYVPKECHLHPSFPCDSFKLSVDEDASPPIHFRFLSHNGFGYDVNITEVFITAENLGASGEVTYAGSCNSTSTDLSLIHPGESFLCVVPITDSERIPRAGEMKRIQIKMLFINCETNPDYEITGDCSSGSLHQIAGYVSTQAELE